MLRFILLILILLGSSIAGPSIEKFDNGSTVFSWVDGRRLETTAGGDKIFTNKDGRQVITKAPVTTTTTVAPDTDTVETIAAAIPVTTPPVVETEVPEISPPTTPPASDPPPITAPTTTSTTTTTSTETVAVSTPAVVQSPPPIVPVATPTPPSTPPSTPPPTVVVETPTPTPLSAPVQVPVSVPVPVPADPAPTETAIVAKYVAQITELQHNLDEATAKLVEQEIKHKTETSQLSIDHTTQLQKTNDLNKIEADKCKLEITKSTDEYRTKLASANTKLLESMEKVSALKETESTAANKLNTLQQNHDLEMATARAEDAVAILEKTQEIETLQSQMETMKSKADDW